MTEEQTTYDTGRTSAATSAYGSRGAGSLAAASAEKGQNLNPKDAEQLLFYDTETTGLPDFKVPSDAPHQPHLVQLAAVLIHVPTRSVVDSFCVIVKPDGTPDAPAWVSDPKALEAHGITTERAFAEGIPEAEALNLLLSMWNRAQGRVAHNEQFDRRIVRIATMRYLGRDAADVWYHACFNCTQFLASAVMQMPATTRMKAAGFGGKPKAPKLTEAHQFFVGRPLEGAHDARNDVNGCIAVYFAIQDGITTDQTPAMPDDSALPIVDQPDHFEGIASPLGDVDKRDGTFACGD